MLVQSHNLRKTIAHACLVAGTMRAVSEGVVFEKTMDIRAPLGWARMSDRPRVTIGIAHRQAPPSAKGIAPSMFQYIRTLFFRPLILSKIMFLSYSASEVEQVACSVELEAVPSTYQLSTCAVPAVR